MVQSVEQAFPNRSDAQKQAMSAVQDEAPQALVDKCKKTA